MDRIQLKEEPERKNTGMILPDLLLQPATCDRSPV